MRFAVLYEDFYFRLDNVYLHISKHEELQIVSEINTFDGVVYGCYSSNCPFMLLIPNHKIMKIMTVQR